MFSALPESARGSGFGDDWTLTDSDTTLVTTPAPATDIPRPRPSPSDWSDVSQAGLWLVGCVHSLSVTPVTLSGDFTGDTGSDPATPES